MSRMAIGRKRVAFVLCGHLSTWQANFHRQQLGDFVPKVEFARVNILHDYTIDTWHCSSYTFVLKKEAFLKL